MKSEDNIKKFFEKRLQDDRPADDLWNVPSDDIWDSAKVHFPKKKKKKRPFLFFLFGAGLLLLVATGLSIWMFGNADQDALIVEKMEIESVNENINENENRNENEIRTESVNENINENIEAGNSIVGQSITPKVIKNEVVTNSRTNAPKKEITIYEESAGSDELNKRAVVETPGVELLVENENESENESESVNENENGKIDEVTAASDLVQKNEFLAVDQLPVLSAEIEKEEQELQDFKMNVNLIKPKRNVHRWEVGLSHSRFLINFKKAVLEDSEPKANETLKLGFKYRNLNIPVSRWFNRRWSMTSGLYYTHIDLELDFSVEEPFEMEPTDADFRKILQESSPAGELTINDASQELNVEFIDNANVQNGDTLLINGAVPLRLQVVQLPILLNYHYGKGKLQGLLHTGVSIDYLFAEIKNIEFDVFKDDILISKPIDFSPLRIDEIGFSVYFGVGMKYYLNDRFNIGWSTKVDLTAIPLSRHEIGVYYGF